LRIHRMLLTARKIRRMLGAWERKQGPVTGRRV
jgi:hypothetical protein